MNDRTTDSPDAAPARAPFVDADGLLRFDGRWVAVPDAQLPIVRLLVDRFGHLVRGEELMEAYVAAGGSAHEATQRAAIARVRRRVATLGLRLHVVRRRGVVLDLPERAGTTTER